MMKRPTRRSLILKVLCSYLVILILPILLFTGFVGFFCNRYIIDAMLGKQQLLAERYVDELNGLIGRFQKIAGDMKLDKIFIREYAREIPAVFYDIQDYLIDATAMLDMAADVCYYTLSDNRTYTSLGVYGDYPELDTIMRQCAYLKNSRWMTGKDRICYIVPLEYSENGTVLGAAVFSISRGYFDEQLKYANMYQNTVNTISFDSVELYRSAGVPPAREADKAYFHVYADPARGRGFRIDHYIPKSFILTNRFYPVQIAALFAVLMLSTGGIVVWIMLRRNYLPIQRVLLRILMESQPSGALDSVSTLDTAVDHIITQKRSLLTDNRLLLRERYLRRLIDGSAEDGKDPGMPDGVALTGPCYVCVFLDAAAAESLKMPADVSHERVSLSRQSCCIILSAGKLVLVDALRQIESGLSGGEGRAGLGDVVESRARVHESFLHARIARNEAVRRRTGAVQYSGAEGGRESDYPYDLLDALDTACRGGDGERIVCLTDMLRSAVLARGDRFLGACIFEDFLKSAAYGLEALRIEGIDGLSLRDEYYRIRPSTCQMMADSMSNIALLVRSRIQERQRRPGAVTLEALKDYLDANFMSPGFSLKALAYDLETSPSNLSHFFKKGMGITLTEYVDTLKIEYAKGALTDPSHTVSDIGRQLGFANSSTFIRKFKALVGVTPGDYRAGLIP